MKGGGEMGYWRVFEPLSLRPLVAPLPKVGFRFKSKTFRILTSDFTHLRLGSRGHKPDRLQASLFCCLASFVPKF